MSSGNKEKYVVINLLPRISHFSAFQGDTPLCSGGARHLSFVVNACFVSFVSLVLGSHLLLPKCVQQRVFFRWESWFLSFLNPEWSWVLNKIMLKLQHSEFEGFYYLAIGLRISEVPHSRFNNLGPLSCSGEVNNCSEIKKYRFPKTKTRNLLRCFALNHKVLYCVTHIYSFCCARQSCRFCFLTRQHISIS